jgi:hypothetical protein
MTSSKVAAVLWTRRPDRYTLQVVFPKASGVPDGRPRPAVTFWLLAADGTTIPVTKVTPPKPPRLPDEVAFSIPLDSGRSAVAIALKVDDEYFIEHLELLD